MNHVERDMFLLECPTYQDYVDTFVTVNDMRFLHNMRFCRSLVDLGYRSEIYSKEEFDTQKAAVQKYLFPTKQSRVIFSEKMESNDPVLIELAQREKQNVEKALSTIIHLSYRLRSGFEVSGYIDYEDSLHQAHLKTEGCTNWWGVFEGRIKLRPRITDLSFFNWHSNKVHYNNSENYMVRHDAEKGLVFMHRGDHKMICVDTTRKSYLDNCIRSAHFSEIYGEVVLYDHIVRRKI